MAKRSKPEPEKESPTLLMALSEATKLLEERIALGKSLGARSIRGPIDLQQARDEYKLWDDYNTALLRKMFSNSEIADEYSAWVGGSFPSTPHLMRKWMTFFSMYVSTPPD